MEVKKIILEEEDKLQGDTETDDSLLPYTVEVTSLPIAKTLFRSLYDEADALPIGSEGRSINLTATDTTGKPLIYAQLDGTNVGLLQKESDIERTYHIICNRSFSAHLTGTTEDGRILISIRESNSDVSEDYIQLGNLIEKELIQNEVLSQEELNERIGYLKEAGINKGDSDYAIILRNIKRGTVPKPETIYKVVGKKSLNPMHELLISMALGENVILEGPKSVGKNVMYETAGWFFQSRIILLQCNGRMTKAEMFGFEATDNSAKNSLTGEGLMSFLTLLANGNTSESALDFAINLAKSMSPTLKMENGSILEALEIANRGEGVILVLDEMNLCEPNTLSGAINDIADGHTPEIFIAGKGKIRINRDCFMLGATQNGTGGDFVGTRKQNDATMSRFSCIKMKAPNSIISILRQMEITGIEDSIYDTFDLVYRTYKDGVQDGIYPMSCLNIRGFKAALKRISAGRDIKTSISICVNNTVPNDADTKLLDSALDSII